MRPLPSTPPVRAAGRRGLASRSRGDTPRLTGGERSDALRLLVVALPLSLAATVALGAVLLPATSYAILVVVACTVIPIDLASAVKAIRDERVPLRVRNLLTVESGYNDGIVAPLFCRLGSVWSSANHIRMALILAPLLAYGTAIELSANGFIAAFVCGIGFRAVRAGAPADGSEISLVED
ncbi:MAG TPA: hypothetical protein VIQ49_20125, partial [Williamsia sp.]